MSGYRCNCYLYNKDPLLKFSLLTRDSNERKEVSQEYLKTSGFKNCVEMAMTNMMKYIFESSVVSNLQNNDQIVMKMELEVYKNGIFTNFDRFQNF